MNKLPHRKAVLVAQVAQAALFSQLGKEQDDLKLEVEEPFLVVQICSNLRLLSQDQNKHPVFPLCSKSFIIISCLYSWGTNPVILNSFKEPGELSIRGWHHSMICCFLCCGSDENDSVGVVT